MLFSRAKLKNTLRVASSSSRCGLLRLRLRNTANSAGRAFCAMASEQQLGSSAVVQSSVCMASNTALRLLPASSASKAERVR